jgi:micrococcal nuclease
MKSLSPLKRLLLIFILVAFSSSQALSISQIEPAKVLRLVDGDTLKVNYKGKEETVRLIGIDAPESRPNKKAIKDAERSGEDLKTITAMGKEATKFVKTLVRPGTP